MTTDESTEELVEVPFTLKQIWVGMEPYAVVKILKYNEETDSVTFDLTAGCGIDTPSKLKSFLQTAIESLGDVEDVEDEN